MTEIVLHGIPQSNFVWAVRIALAEKGLSARLEPSAPHTPPVDTIHPLGRIPVFTHGDVTVFESRAIVTYIDRAFDGPALVSGDPVEAAADEAWTSFLITAVDPVVVRKFYLALFFPGTPDGKPDPVRIAAVMPEVTRMFSILDKAAADGVILGERFRLPDAWAIPILFYASILPDYTTLVPAGGAIVEKLPAALARASVASTMPPPLPGAA